MNFARLNHILVPKTKAERDRYRNSPKGRFLRRMFMWAILLTDEGRGAFLLWLLASAIGINVGTTQFFYLSTALTGLLIASLVVTHFFRLNGVRLNIQAPSRTVAGEVVTFSITLTNNSNETYQSIRFRSPFLPWDGQWITHPGSVATLRPGTDCHLTAKARFVARGEHHLDVFEAAALVPLGLANGPEIESDGVRFWVVPRIANVVAFQTPLTPRYQPGGVNLASGNGESRELMGVRPYRSGDPIRDLHPGSWAKTGQPHVREYQQEYFTRIGVVVDTDMSRATEAQFEAALSLAAGVISLFSRKEALIDLLVLGRETAPLVLGQNLGFIDQALDLLACVNPGPSLTQEKLQAQVEPHLHRLSTVVFITLNWDDTRQSFPDWVLSRGVGCRVACVAQKHDPSWPDDDGSANTFTVAEIEGQEAIYL